YNTWINIKNNLIQRNERVEFQTFFRHYWISKHKKVTEDQLYNEFIKTIPKDKYKSFIEDMEKASKQYVKLICPIPDDYRKRREFMYIIESLNYFNSYFNIKQVRVILLALFDTRFNRKLISGSEFKKILVYLHQFHFAYNALCTKRANALESKYSKFAQRINSAENKQSAHKIIDELRRELDELFPSYNEFEKSFIKLEYSKGKNDYNMLSKYVLNNIEKHYSNEDVSKNNGSVEHILAEDKSKKYSLNIGNLILLEDYLNEKAENKDLCEKINIYYESKYEYVKEFESSYKDIKEFNEELIKERAKKMAEDYYYNILGRKKHDNLTHKSS
ncbi:MAG: HNH endonuclease family protein, partial [Paraclostridium sp.]